MIVHLHAGSPKHDLKLVCNAVNTFLITDNLKIDILYLYFNLINILKYTQSV